MGYNGSDVSGSAVGFMLIFYLVYILVMFGIFIAQYVLRAWGMYAIAKRRGIQKPWLSWIPIGESWLLGSISDQYQYVAKGKVKNKRKTLLVLQILLAGITVAFVIAYVVMVVQAVLHSGLDMETMMIGVLVWILVFWLFMAGISIALSVITYMALYDLYRSCEPSNAVLYLVLSILFGITQPIFVFICRNKDVGMPPRRDTIPPAEPWEN